MEGNLLFLIVLVTVYVFVMGYLGYRGYRGTRTAGDYLVAGREIHPFIMAMSYGAAFISTSAVVGFGGAAAVFGLGILWLVVLNVFVGIFLAFVVIGVRTRFMGHRLNAHTFPELIARGTAIFFGLCAATFLPMFIGGLYTRRITKTAAVWGAVVGLAVSAFWLVFVHIKESSALLICEKLFGVPSLLEGVRTGFILWPEVDPLSVALPLSLLVTIVLSFMTRPYSTEHLDACFGARR